MCFPARQDFSSNQSEHPAPKFRVRVFPWRKPEALPLPWLNYAEKVTVPRLLPGVSSRVDRAPCQSPLGSAHGSAAQVRMVLASVHCARIYQWRVSGSHLRRCVEQMANLKSVCKCARPSKIPLSQAFSVKFSTKAAQVAQSKAGCPVFCRHLEQ